MTKEIRKLGKTRLGVSRIGLGMAALGRPGYINLSHADDMKNEYDVDAMESRAHQVLDAAWKGGVRYFDAARSYGKGEEFLASWLKARNISSSEVTVGSKWGYTYTAGWQVDAEKHEVKEHSLEVLRRQIAESRCLFGDHLNLYQIHSATLESGVLENQAVLEELGRIRGEGVVIGLSLTGTRQVETLQKAIEVEIGGGRLFGCVQATWNLLEPSVGGQLEMAHREGMGVIVKEALANGRLTHRNKDALFVGKSQVLESVADELKISVDALALASVLAQSWADVVLSGAARVEHLESNLAALKVHISAEILSKLGVVREVSEEYWETRKGLAWN